MQESDAGWTNTMLFRVSYTNILYWWTKKEAAFSGMVDNSLIKNLPELFVPFQEAAYLCLINIWLFGKTDVVWSDVYVQFDHVDIGCLLNFYDISSEFTCAVTQYQFRL